MQKLYETICNDTANNSSRPNLLSTVFRSTFRAMEYELDNVLIFSCMLAQRFSNVEALSRFFQQKFCKTIRDHDASNNSSRFNLLFIAFTSILGTMS